MVLHDIERKKMIQMASDARVRAYSPYSKYAVGACLKGDSGAYYLGCNIENATYGASNCAERTAVFKAISESERHFSAIVVVTEGDKVATPCGICRQVLAEFADDDMAVVCANTKGEFIEYTLGMLLHNAFRMSNLNND